MRSHPAYASLHGVIANGVQFTSSSNEIVKIIGSTTSDTTPVGFMISSKVRRDEIGLSVAGGSSNVNTAKLFIR